MAGFHIKLFAFCFCCVQKNKLVTSTLLDMCASNKDIVKHTNYYLTHNINNSVANNIRTGTSGRTYQCFDIISSLFYGTYSIFEVSLDV